MKTFLQALVLVAMLLCLDTPVGIAQVLPQKVLDTAKSQFEKAYQKAHGQLPPAAATASAMRTYIATVNGLAANLGQRAGQKAKRLQNMRLGFDQLDGPSLIGVLDDIRFNSLSEFGFTKSRVVELAAPDMPVNQFDGKLLVKDPQAILKIKANTEIVFPAGNYALNERALVAVLENAGEKFPKGIAFVGAGKEKTTLKVTDASFTRSDVDRLSFRDMTIDCDNDGLFDKRQGSLTLRLSNVRLVRFDAGHGGCRLFSINEGLIVHATETEFVAGFGRSPGNGSIFVSTDIFLGYFERCQFSGINEELFRQIRERNSVLWMDNCSFDRTYQTNANVQLKDCKFDFTPPKLRWIPQD